VRYFEPNVPGVVSRGAGCDLSADWRYLPSAEVAAEFGCGTDRDNDDRAWLPTYGVILLAVAALLIAAADPPAGD